MDSFSLYCLATEIDRAETLRVLGLIESRLSRDAGRSEDQLYKGALLARLGMDDGNCRRSQRFIDTGLSLMRKARPSVRYGAVVALQMLYARALTTAILPRPPVPLSETSGIMAALLNHPGFGRLHPLRQASAIRAAADLPLRRVDRDRHCQTFTLMSR